MTEIKLIRELLMVAILAAIIGTIIAAVFAPEQFGRWMQKIDTGRYYPLECVQ